MMFFEEKTKYEVGSNFLEGNSIAGLMILLTIRNKTLLPVKSFRKILKVK